MRFSLGVALGCFLLAWVQFTLADLDPKRVHFIDKGVSPSGVTNYLFRGNEPKVNGTSGLVSFFLCVSLRLTSDFRNVCL
jgi:hypothetical protein